MLFEPAIGDVAAVPRQNFRPGAVGYDTVLVGVAKDELAGLQKLARTCVGSTPFPSIAGSDNLSREPKCSCA